MRVQSARGLPKDLAANDRDRNGGRCNLHGLNKNAHVGVPANIHKSLDGTRVMNYAQWGSKDGFEVMLRNPEAAPHMKAREAIAKLEHHLYAVAAV
jgi:hypothetical protein